MNNSEKLLSGYINGEVKIESMCHIASTCSSNSFSRDICSQFVKKAKAKDGFYHEMYAEQQTRMWFLLIKLIVETLCHVRPNLRLCPKTFLSAP